MFDYRVATRNEDKPNPCEVNTTRVIGMLYMAMGRVEFRNGVAIVYDELGRKRTEKQCDQLIGYGPKGFVIKVNWSYRAHNPNGVIVEQGISERVFLDKKQWEWHDSFLRIRM